MTSTLIDNFGKPISIRRGTSPVFTFTIVVEGTTDPKNLVAAEEIIFAIGARREARSYDLILTLGNGVTYDGEGGHVTVALTKEQTEALPLGNRWAELIITDNIGQRDIPGAGTCFVYDSLTTVP